MRKNRKGWAKKQQQQQQMHSNDSHMKRKWWKSERWELSSFLHACTENKTKTHNEIIQILTQHQRQDMAGLDVVLKLFKWMHKNYIILYNLWML